PVSASRRSWRVAGDVEPPTPTMFCAKASARGASSGSSVRQSSGRNPHTRLLPPIVVRGSRSRATVLTSCVAACSSCAANSRYVCDEVPRAKIPVYGWLTDASWTASEGRATERASAHRLLHQRGDLRLVGRRELPQRVRGRPHPALIEVRLVAEPERRVPRLELRRVLEEAHHLVVFGVRRHPVPRPLFELGRGGHDDRVDTLRHRTVLPLHLGD